MRQFDRVMTTVNWLLVLFVCIVGVLAFIIPMEDGFRDLLTGTLARTLLMLVSLALLVLELVWMWKSVRSRFVTFTNDRGQIKVAAATLERSLARSVAEQKEVRSAAVRILAAHVPKGPIDITAYVKITECPDLLGVQGTIQQILETRFNEMLETARPKRFNVEIVALKKSIKPKPQPVPDDFTGPQFPIREEEE